MSSDQNAGYLYLFAIYIGGYPTWFVGTAVSEAILESIVANSAQFRVVFCLNSVFTRTYFAIDLFVTCQKKSRYFQFCVFLPLRFSPVLFAVVWCPNVFAPLCFCPLPPGLFNWFMFDLLSPNQWTLPCYSICPDLVFWGGFGFSQCYFFAFLRSSPITCLVLDVVCPVWVGSHVSSKKDIKILNFNVPRF